MLEYELVIDFTDQIKAYEEGYMPEHSADVPKEANQNLVDHLKLMLEHWEDKDHPYYKDLLRLVSKYSVLKENNPYGAPFAYTKRA